MDNQRLILFIALSFVLLLIWQAWQADYGPQPPPAAPEAGAPEAAAPTDVPSVQAGAAAPQAAVEAAASAPRGQGVHVRTDVLDVIIDTRGGDVRQALLPTYPIAVDEPEKPFHLLRDDGSDVFIAQSGLLAPDNSAPNHYAEYTAEQLEYALADGADRLAVRLRWTGANGLEVTKVYTFRRGSFVVDVAYEVRNGTGADWKGRPYAQLQHGEVGDRKSAFIYTYTGAVLYTEETKYKKLDFEDMKDEPLGMDAPGGWAAMIQHYFLAAWVPKADEANHYYTKAVDGPRYVIGVVQPGQTIAPGASATFASRLYVGPKLQDHLAEVAPGLELTVDYGYLTFIAQPIFVALKYINKVVGNWGWSIIILTALIKLLFYKLSETSYRSMANMRKLQPRLVALKERYGDDRQRLNQAMMELYKKEKINPLGGCLPILVQIPVFIALYWVLLETVEMRQAPFVLWLNDLSTADPYFVLPLLMGATMFIQQKLNPAPVDPIQQKVMMILPVVFTVFFAFFPSGLVLYWVTNNALSIAQQWVITRRVEQGAK